MQIYGDKQQEGNFLRMTEEQFKYPNNIVQTVIFARRGHLDLHKAFSKCLSKGEANDKCVTRDLTENAPLASRDHIRLS